MKKLLLNLVLLSAAVSLVGCSSNPFKQETLSSQQHSKSRHSSNQNVSENNEAGSGKSIGGNLAGAMDELDKSKMLHALDKAPGTSTHWVNANTGIGYTVVPVKKVVVNGNENCRKYTTTASKDDKEKQSGGTACVSDDGNWKLMN